MLIGKADQNAETKAEIKKENIMKTLKTVLAGLAVVALAAGAYAGEGEGKGKGNGKVRKEIQAFHQEQKKARQEFHKGMKEKREALRESCKDLEVSAIVTKLRSHCESAYAERTAFHEKQYQARVAFGTELAEKHDIPDEKVTERQAEAKDRHDKAVKHFDTQHAENLAFLDKLAGDGDLTKEGLREQLKAHMETQRKENQAFMKDLRPDRGQRKGQRNGKGKNTPAEE